MSSTASKHRIVIVGGGAGGLELANPTPLTDNLHAESDAAEAEEAALAK